MAKYSFYHWVNEAQVATKYLIVLGNLIVNNENWNVFSNKEAFQLNA